MTTRVIQQVPQARMKSKMGVTFSHAGKPMLQRQFDYRTLQPTAMPSGGIEEHAKSIRETQTEQGRVGKEIYNSLRSLEEWALQRNVWNEIEKRQPEIELLLKSHWGVLVKVDWTLTGFDGMGNRHRQPAGVLVYGGGATWNEAARNAPEILRGASDIKNWVWITSLGAEPVSLGTQEESLEDAAKQPLSSKAPAQLQKKLTVNTPGDKYEQEADRVAEQVMRMPEPQVQRQCACGKSSTEGECSECKKKKQGANGSLQLVASSPVGGMAAPPIVNSVLSSPGSPLPTATRSFMESRFGQDFSDVRVHTDAQAQNSAQGVSARAYTVGHQIVFGSGQFQPESAFGKHLLAHELAHVVQQSGKSSVAQPMLLQRYSYDEGKRDFYRGLISGLKTARFANVSAMRGVIALLPDNVKGVATHVVEVVDTVMDVTIQLDLFVVGMAVGFGEGIVGMIKGLLSLGYSILKTLWHVVSGFFTGFDPLKRDVVQFLAALVGLPGAMKELVTSWMTEFEHAPMARQSLMIGELTGQIEALIATFALSAGRAGTVAKVASEGAEAGEVATTATRGAEVVDLASLRASKVAQATESAGTTGKSASTSASAFDGAAARQISPLTEPAVVQQPAKVIKFPKPIPANEFAALPKPPPSKLPVAVGAAATAAAIEDKRRRKQNAMSVQIQWTSFNNKRYKQNNKNGKVNFSRSILRDPKPGVTVSDVVTTFDGVLSEVKPRDARREAVSKRPNLVGALSNVRDGGGILESEGGRNVRVDLDIDEAKGGRIDVVNHRGHNLRS